MPDSRTIGRFHPANLLATWFGVGYLPKAPGTWGSLAALPFAWVISATGGPIALLIAAAVALAIGIWAAEQLEKATQAKDPGHVVIDEVAGQWLTLVPIAPDPFLYAIGFLLFRIADIFKPWPANWCDRRLSGGLGVMLDDIVAGAYAGIALMLIVEFLL